MTEKSYVALGTQQVKEIREICDDALGGTRITAWEREFCTNMLSRLDQWDTHTRVSEAQWETIRRIEVKVYAT